VSREPIAVLLLPRALEHFALREQAQELLRAPGVVAVEPGLVPPAAFGRLGDRRAARLARGQARRLLRRLPGRPAAVVLFDPLGWPLARELTDRTGAELWYGPGEDPDAGAEAPSVRERVGRLHAEAARAAALRFAADERSALRTRLRRLGIDAGAPA
jgi:hypothetical protein